MADWREPDCSSCSSPMEFIISAPSFSVWKSDRAFPNMSPFGEGETGAMTFESKSAYERHLEANNMAEWSTSAPVKRAHGNKVVFSDGRH